MHILASLLVTFFVMSISIKSLAIDSENTKRILVLNSGILFGYMETLVLEEIESLLQRPIAKTFDFIGGTSTGAVIASLLALKHGDAPSFTAAEVRHFYETYGQDIFKARTMAISPLLSARDIHLIMDHVTNNAVTILPAVFRSKQVMDLGQKLKSAFLERGMEALNEEFTRMSLNEVKSLSKSIDLEVYKDFMAHELQGISAYIHEANYYFDAQLFKTRLVEKLGETTTMGQMATPVALFSTAYPVKRADLLVQLIDHDLGVEVDGYNSKPEAMVFSSIEERAYNIRLVDAVYASAAASDLFPPIELVFDGQTKSFIDGDVFDHSTEKETIKLARKRWPLAHLEVFVLGYTRDTIPIVNRKKAIDNGMVIDLRVPITGFRTPESESCSDDNFALMRELATSFIQTDYFKSIIDSLLVS